MVAHTIESESRLEFLQKFLKSLIMEARRLQIETPTGMEDLSAYTLRKLGLKDELGWYGPYYTVMLREMMESSYAHDKNRKRVIPQWLSEDDWLAIREWMADVHGRVAWHEPYESKAEWAARYWKGLVAREKNQKGGKMGDSFIAEIKMETSRHRTYCRALDLLREDYIRVVNQQGSGSPVTDANESQQIVDERDRQYKNDMWAFKRHILGG